MYYCGDCKKWECRCESCYFLIEKNKQWHCDQYQKDCKEIEECFEWEEHEGECNGRI